MMLIFFSEVGDGSTLLSCPSCSSDAVNVVLYTSVALWTGKVVVDDVRHIRDVNATSGYVCGKENLNFSVPKGIDGSRSCILLKAVWTFAVERDG